MNPESFQRDLQHIWNHSPSPLLVFDAEGVVISANPAAESTFGRALEGKSFDAFFATGEDFSTFRERGIRDQVRMINVRTDAAFGATFRCQFITSDIRTIVIASAADHSQAEAQTKILEENIKANNLMRSLRQKSRELELLNEEKTRLLGTAAHDLRSPLAVIHSFTEILEYLGEAQSPQARQALGRIKDVSSQALTLLNETLNYAQIQSGKIELQRTTTDLISIVSNCVELQKPLAQKRHVGVEWEIPESEVAVSVDAVRLGQALDNLMSNAIKHTPSDGTVTVHAVREPRAAIVSVTDQGPGLAPEDLHAIFEPFGKSASESKSGESTGLGLAITKRLIELHGGQVSVESEPGQGATFSLRLPLD